MFTSPSFRSSRSENSSRTYAPKAGKNQANQAATTARAEQDAAAPTGAGESERLAAARLPQAVAAQRRGGRLQLMKDVLLMAVGRDDEEDYECAHG